MAKMTLQQFIDEYNGKQLDFDNAYGYQCVDMWNFYNDQVVGAPFIGTPVTNGARDLFEVDSSARRAYYDVLPASVELKAGDTVVYGEPHGRAVVNGVQVFFGHVAVYIGNNQMINQRGRKGEVVSIDPLITKSMLGVLRPRNFESNIAPQIVPAQPQNKNKHIITSGDTFWGLEESNGWDHGILQQLNPNINHLTLQIGTEIDVPGNENKPAVETTTYYTITSGDTFWDLENAWGLEHGRLQQLNPELEPRALQIGQSIRRS